MVTIRTVPLTGHRMAAVPIALETAAHSYKKGNSSRVT